MDQLYPFLEVGVIYGIGAIGLGLGYRYLKFPDFTAVGSITLGAIIGAVVGSHASPYLALLAAFATGMLLGTVTALQTELLGVPLVVSGIATCIASATPGYWFTVGGNVSIPEGEGRQMFDNIYSTGDMAFLVVLMGGCALSIDLLMRTKIGTLILALGADARFVGFRHRYRGRVRTLVLSLGNGLVGLAGGLGAIKSGSAYVPDHLDFLPFALGGILAGTAVALLLATPMNSVGKWLADIAGKRNPRIRETIENLFIEDSGVGQKAGLTFFAYGCGCAFLYVVNGALMANAFGGPGGLFDIPQPLRPITYLMVAIVMSFAVWLAGSREEN